jgi:hypothetical protein
VTVSSMSRTSRGVGARVPLGGSRGRGPRGARSRRVARSRRPNSRRARAGPCCHSHGRLLASRPRRSPWRVRVVVSRAMPARCSG